MIPYHEFRSFHIIRHFYLKPRAFWSFIIFIGMCLSILLSWGMFQKYATSKLMTSIESTHEPLNRFEFPAVTVCSQNRFSKSKLKRIHAENPQLQVLTENELLLIMKVMVKPDTGFNRTNQMGRIQQLLDSNGVTIDQMIKFNRQVSSINDIAMKCFVSCNTECPLIIQYNLFQLVI